MQYVLLIHQGDAPTPYTPDEWGRLSEDEQKAVYADYQAINETPGVTPPGSSCSRRRRRPPCGCEDGKTLTTDGPFVAVKEALGGCLIVRGRRPRRRDRARVAHSGGAHGRRDRGAPGRGVVALTARAGLPRRVGPRPRRPDRLPRRLRPRRGSRAGGVRGRRGALAARRDAGQPARLARDDRAQPCDRPDPPRSHARSRRPACSTCPKPWRTSWTRRRSRTSASSWSSPAAIRRSTSMPRSR